MTVFSSVGNAFNNLFKPKKPITPSVVQTAQRTNYAVTSPTKQLNASYKNPYTAAIQTASKAKPVTSQTPTYQQYLSNKVAKPIYNAATSAINYGIQNPKQAAANVMQKAPLIAPFSPTARAIGTAGGYLQGKAPASVPQTGTTKTQFQNRWNEIKAQQDAAAAEIEAQKQPVVDPYAQFQTNQIGAVDQQYNTDKDFLQKQYDARLAYLNGQVDPLKQNFEKYKGDVQAGVNDQVAATDQLKQNLNTQFGTSQRDRASVRRDLQGAREKQYAALNSIDSAGTGSFTEANTNDDAAFQRDTANAISARDQGLSQADRDLAGYKRQAQGLIDTENSKLQDSIRQIMADTSTTQAEKDYAIQSAYNQAKAQKQSIMDQFMQKKLETTATGLSQGFMTTGIPQTAADYDYYVKNPKGVEAVKSVIGGVSGSPEKQNLVGLIDELTKSDLGSVSGLGQYAPWNGIPGSGAQLTSNKLNQLLSSLSLDNRTKLQGSGAISDFEARMLANASSSLGRNLSPEDLKAQLLQLKQSLAGGQQSNNNDPLGLGL